MPRTDAPPPDPKLRARIARVLREAGWLEALGPGRLTLEPIDGGLGRRTYLASAATRACVVRTVATGDYGVLDLEDEARLTDRAAALGIAPRVVAVDRTAGIIATEHLAGARALTRAEVREPANAERIAVLLRQLHALEMPLRRFDPEDFAAQYLGALEAARELSPDERRHALELRALARRYGERCSGSPADGPNRQRSNSVGQPSSASGPPSSASGPPSSSIGQPSVPCHNDLIASNILAVRGRLHLVDFEYAVAAAPVLDLAGLAVMNDLDGVALSSIVRAYHGDEAVPFTAAELGETERLVRLIGYFWALAGAAAPAAAESGPYRAFAAQARKGLQHIEVEGDDDHD